jgi:hypothetical protein
VKTNARTFGFWLVPKSARQAVSPTHVYVLVNLRRAGREPEYFVLPSRELAKRMAISNAGWHHIKLRAAEPFRDGWHGG